MKRIIILFVCLIVTCCICVALFHATEMPAYIDYKQKTDSEVLSNFQEDTVDSSINSVGHALVYGPQPPKLNAFPNHSHIPGKKKKAKHWGSGLGTFFVSGDNGGGVGVVTSVQVFKDSLYLDTLHGYIRWVQVDTVELGPKIYAAIPFMHHGLATIVDSVRLWNTGIQPETLHRQITVRELPSMRILMLDPHKSYDFTSTDKFQQP